MTIALYGIATLTLYQNLLARDWTTLRYAAPMRVMQWLCLPMLLAAVVVPYRVYLPMLWVISHLLPVVDDDWPVQGDRCIA